MTNMIKYLEEQILDQIIQEGKDPVDASIKANIAEWKALQKKVAVIQKMSKAITTRIAELETGFEEVIKEVNGNKAVVDGAIVEFTQKKSNTTVKYKEVVDYALKMVNEAQKEVLEKFIKSVTNESKITDVLAVTDPELEQFLLDLKRVEGEELLDKIETMARSGFEKLPKQIENAKKRALKEAVANNVVKVIKNIVATFKTKFKKFFKALDKQKKAAEDLVKAVKADPKAE